MTNNIYFTVGRRPTSNSFSVDGHVGVIDGFTDEISDWLYPGQYSHSGFAINETSNLIYVGSSSYIDVINGVDNATMSPIALDDYAHGNIAVNKNTNKLYSINWLHDQLKVVDINTNQITIIDLTEGDADALEKSRPTHVAVNSETNRIYVVIQNNSSTQTEDYNQVIVIDGETNSIIEKISVAYASGDISINEATNTIYLTHQTLNMVSVIQGLSPELSAVNNLVNEVDSLDLKWNKSNVLVNKLFAVYRNVDDENDNNDQANCSHLDDFINEVHNMESKGDISPDDSITLITAAEDMKSDMYCL